MKEDRQKWKLPTSTVGQKAISLHIAQEHLYSTAAYAHVHIHFRKCLNFTHKACEVIIIGLCKRTCYEPRAHIQQPMLEIFATQNRPLVNLCET